MTPIRNLLSDAVRYGLAAGAVGFAGLASMSALAQDTTAPSKDSTKAKNLDRVEVIGSRIKRAVDTEPTAPVTVMTKADIQQTGLTNTWDVINHLTASDGTGIGTTSVNTNAIDGESFVSLRNLGPQRTLVLVDGKRWNTTIGGAVDLSTIPVAIIERVEVLKDGASAIYGSDAIAGVINIITRKKFEGAQADWSYGQTSHGDGQQESESVTVGANGEHTSAVISLSRIKQTPVWQADRKVSQFPAYGCASLLSNYPASDPNGEAALGFCGSSASLFGRAYLTTGGSWTLNNSYWANGNQPANPYGAVNTAPGTKPSDFHRFSPLDRYNYAPANYIQIPSTANNLYASGRFDINDSVSAYARVSYTEHQATMQLAEVPGGLNIPSFGTPWQGFNLNQSIFDPWAATGQQIIAMRYRFGAVGPRIDNHTFHNLGSTAGLQGSFTLGDHNFDWDTYVQYNSEHDSDVGANYINLFNLKQAVGPSFADVNGLHCGVYTAGATDNGAIAGCMPFNLFGGPAMGVGNKYKTSDGSGTGGYYTVTAADVANMLNYVRYSPVSADGNKGYNIGATISGEILPLQGGQLQFAAGVEQRRQNSYAAPDSLVAAGGSSTNFSLPTSGSTKQTDEFLEIDAPLLKGLPGAQELELDAAVRHSSTGSSGSLGQLSPAGIPVYVSYNPKSNSPTETKISLRWKPFDDLLIRSSYGGTFRAPAIADLYSGAAQSFPNALDPCSTGQYAALSPAGQATCRSQGVPVGGTPYTGSTQLLGINGGNPGLKPEKGHDFTVGAVWSPSWEVLKGLNVTVDYWQVRLKNVITQFGAGQLFTDCYVGGSADECAKIVRLPNGVLSYVNQTSFNAAGYNVNGIDTGLTYHWDTGHWGDLNLKWDTTYTRRDTYTVTSTGGGTSTERLVGFYTGGPNWRWRSNATLSWTMGDWDASWSVRFYSPLIDNIGCSLADFGGFGAKPMMCNRPNGVVYDNFFNPAGQGGSGPGGRALGYNHVGATTYHDLQVGWKAPWKAHLSIGARNIFGKEPPLVAGTGNGGSFDGAYDFPGGPFYYFQYRQDF
ncbi:MAG: TonB-dependent receptor [Proteobacteria bacterium]|nr:TonB-dependent receptor [Pseudomonadota bacterium]